MNALANIAVLGLLVILALSAMGTLTGVDRWLDERRNKRDRDRFDVFTDGRWRR